jgi:hypothetical protein
MSSVNPYSSPLVDSPYVAKLAGPPQGMWREGDTLVLRIGTQLPPRCLKSNEPTKEIWTRKLQWHPQWVLALILVHILIYIIVALILTKRATFDFPLTEPWRARRRNAIIVGWLIALAAVAMFIGGLVLVNERSTEMLGGILLIASPFALIFGALWGIYRGRLLWPTKIDDNFAWVKGACPEYLAEMPNWPGPYEAFNLSQSRY